MTTQHTDYLIVGAGIVGLTLARRLKQAGVDRIIVIEKETQIGKHASGRNSGVLHAGIYYPPETLKAKVCLKGNRLLQAYCREKNLPLQNVGKVVVAKNQDELNTLYSLHKRAQEGGINADLIDEQRLATIEPNAKTYKNALYVTDTAIVDSKAILQAIYNELIESGVSILFNHQFETLHADHVAVTNQGNIHFKYLINAAGAYADQIAHRCGVAKEYYFIPFKGSYRKLIPAQTHFVNGNIYPVPNLKNPFLGVHFTKNIRGDVYVGPTAIPAFGRENYGLLKGIDREAIRIIFNEAKLFFTNPKFRQLALTEPKKYSAKYFYNDAKQLVKHLDPAWIIPCEKVGIRPQLINLNTKELEMDFMLLQEGQHLHILNAISPAFTSSFAFADYVVEKYLS